MVRSGFTRFAAGLACLWALTVAPALAQVPTETEVDLALVVAVDISFSMDTDEQALQREGFAQAFRSKLVHDAIRGGMLGRIAVTYMEWAGSPDQKVIVPWTVLDNSESLMAFADGIASTPLRRAQRTSISSAIDFSVKLLEDSGLSATRQVIDVSGDGPNNQGRLVIEARDAAIKGIIINGLPIMLRQPGYLDIPDLDIYYKDCVIGGKAHSPFRFRARSVHRGHQDQDPARGCEPGARAAADPPYSGPSRTNCMAGEMQWRDRWSN